jgi:hypothetical protein
VARLSKSSSISRGIVVVVVVVVVVVGALVVAGDVVAVDVATLVAGSVLPAADCPAQPATATSADTVNRILRCTVQPYGLRVAAEQQPRRRFVAVPAGQHAAVDEILIGRQNLEMFGGLFGVRRLPAPGHPGAVGGIPLQPDRGGVDRTSAGRPRPQQSDPRTDAGGRLPRRLLVPERRAECRAGDRAHSVAVAFIAKGAEATQSAGFVAIFPLVFASSVFVPVDTMPDRLQGFATYNPVSVTADAARSLSIGGPAASAAR